MKTFAFEKLMGRRRDAVMMLLVFAITLACALASVMLSESVYQSSQAKAKRVYGGWETAILNADEDAIKAMSSMSGIEEVGYAHKSIPLDGGNARYSRWVGAFEPDMIELGQLNVLEGRMPEAEGEIALELTTLSSLGLSYELDQEIELLLPAIWELTDGGNVVVEEWEEEPRVYHLVGILDSYSTIWEEGDANPDMIVWHEDSLMKNVCLTNLYFTSSYTDQDLSEWFEEIYGDNFILNTRLELAMEQAGEPVRIYTVVLLVLTVLAVFLISMVQMKQRTRSVTLFRGLGATPEQLLRLTLWEGVYLMIPAVLIGGLLGVCLGHYGGVSLANHYVLGYVPEIPWVSLGLCGLLWAICVWLGMVLPLWSANRVPLTGAFRMSPSTQRKSRRIRTVLIGAISMLMGVTALYCATTLPWHQGNIYTLLNENVVYLLSSRGGMLMDPELESAVELVPGVNVAYGEASFEVFMEYDGLDMDGLNAIEYYISSRNAEGMYQYLPDELEQVKENRREGWNYTAQNVLKFPVVDLRVLTEKYLDEIKRSNPELDWFDWDAFERGEICILLNPTHIPEELSPCQGDMLTLSAYLRNGAKGTDPTKLESYQRNREETIEVGYVCTSLLGQYGMGMVADYTFTVVCSFDFAEKMFTPVSEQSGSWSSLTWSGAEEYGLQMIWAYANANAAYEVTDKVVSRLAADMGGRIETNNRLYLIETAREHENAMLTTILITAVVATILIVLQTTLRLADLNQQRREFGLRFALGDPRGRQIRKAVVRGVLLSISAMVFALMADAIYGSIRRILIYYQNYHMIVEVKESFTSAILSIPAVLTQWPFWVAFAAVLILNLLIQLLPMRTIFRCSPSELLRDE